MIMKKDKLDILYEDKYILVVNKPNNLLTISTDKEKYNTLYSKVYDYLKKKNKNNKVFIVHRLDKDTSGLVIFAKSEKVKYDLQNNWNSVIRKYICKVYGKVLNDGVIESYLKETKTHLVYSTKDSKNGKYAKTIYKVISYNDNFSLLEVLIKTGRHHQIRVHLKSINHPIVGDKIYSDIKDNRKRLCLHAHYLEFIHPITKENIKLETKIPREINL